MENDQQTPQQPADQVLNPESFQGNDPAEQSPIGKKELDGYTLTDEEELKQFYIKLAIKICPSATSKCTEVEVLRMLHTKICRSCKLLEILDNFDFTDHNPLVAKACGFMLMDTSTSYKEKRKLNDWLFMQSQFMSKMTKLHDLISHNLLFLSRIRIDLRRILHLNDTEEEN